MYLIIETLLCNYIMLHTFISLLQGLFATMPGGPTLDLGICLPASCTYNDINVTMSRESDKPLLD